MCRVLAASLLAAVLAMAPATAHADDDDVSKRSSQEAAVGIVAAGAYTTATALWGTSFVSDAKFEHRLLPALALGAAGAWALSAYDRKHPFAKGTLASVTSGAAVGLGIGLAWVLFDQAGTSPWSHRTSSSLLWGGATLGAGIGALSAWAGTTPGRAAFTGSAAYWTATATGLLLASLGNTRDADRRGFLGAAVSLELGVIAAGWLGRRTNPTVSRVAWAASLALAGGLAMGAGTWLASGRPDLARARATWGASAVGLLGGGVVGWVWAW